MSDSAFDIISKYCLDHGHDVPVRNHSFAIYTQKHKEAIEHHKKTNQGRITPKIESALETTHLAEQELRGYVAEAERIIRAAEEDLLAPYQNKSVWSGFWISVLSSTLGSFFFVLLLFLLFLLAEDQIRPMVHRFMEPKDSAGIEMQNKESQQGVAGYPPQGVGSPER